MKPVVAIYSTFLQRAYDQLIHDVALQNLPVVFAIDRSGLVPLASRSNHSPRASSTWSGATNDAALAPARSGVL